MSDQALLDVIARNGDEIAFTILVERHSRLVYSIALRRMGNPAHAEEIAQQVFITLYHRSINGLQLRSTLANWLFQTTLYQTSRAWRAERRRAARYKRYEKMITQEKDEPPSPVPAWMAHLDEALAKLSKKDREVLLARFFEEKSFPEMALAFDKSEEAVRKTTTRALERLRAKLQLRASYPLALAALTGGIQAEARASIPANLVKSIVDEALLSESLSIGIAELSLASLKTSLYAALAFLVGTSAPIVYQINKNTFLENPSTSLNQAASPSLLLTRSQAKPTDQHHLNLAWLEQELSKFPLPKSQLKRELLVERLMQELSLSDIQKVASILERSKNPAYLREVARSLYARWAALDPEGAMAYLRSGAIGYLVLSGIEGALSVWVEQHPSEALHWLAKDPDTLLSWAAVNDVFSQYQPKRFLEIAWAAKPGNNRDLALEDGLVGWAIKDLEGTLEWLTEKIEPEKQTTTLQSMASELRAKGHLKRSLEIILTLPPSPATFRELSNTLIADVVHAPNKATEAFDSLPPEYQQEPVARALIDALNSEHQTEAASFIDRSQRLAGFSSVITP